MSLIEEKNPDMEKLTAQLKARELIRSRKITALPVDTEIVAQSLGFEISYRDLPDDESGFSAVIKGKKRIVVNKNHEPKRQRFTIFHEIAHDYLKLPSLHDQPSSPPTLGSYVKRPAEEIACDIFAAECLLPWPLLQPYIEEETFCIETVDFLSEEFQASRLCVASRFADQSPGLHAYVLSENGQVVYVARSKPLQDLQYWISIGLPLPRQSGVHSLLSSGQLLAQASYNGVVWSSSDVAGKLFCEEESFSLPKWGQTASLLTLGKISKDDERSAEDEDYDAELLLELTGILPWRKK
jgi:Zn-dependent peptidase ImmA (M78 family)